MNMIIFTLIGIILGGLVTGMFVGTNCAKTYNKKIDELTGENNNLIEVNDQLTEENEYLYSELDARKKEEGFNNE